MTLTRESFDNEITLALLEYMKVDIEEDLEKGDIKRLKELEQIKKNVDDAGLEMVMTSELIYLSMKFGDRFNDDVFMNEWKRRMIMIEMNEDQMAVLVEREKSALSVELKGRNILWFVRKPFWEGMTKDDVPPVEHLTWSEVNLIGDFARYLKAYAHEYMPDALWTIVAEHAYNQPYAHTLNEEGEAMGIPKEIQNKFWYNEGSVLAKYKYKYMSGPTEWSGKK